MVGPWNDYEIVKPVGIRRKQAISDAPQELVDGISGLKVEESK